MHDLIVSNNNRFIIAQKVILKEDRSAQFLKDESTSEGSSVQKPLALV